MADPKMVRELLAHSKKKSVASAARLPPRDPDGPLRGRKLREHNERAYRAKGWVKGRDGIWRPRPATPRRPPNGGSVA